MPDASLPQQIDLSALAESPVDISQYLGVWSIEETHARYLLQWSSQANWAKHLAEHAHTQIAAPTLQSVDLTAASSEGMATEGEPVRIAIISLSGPLTKRGSSMSDAGSTIRARREVRNASRDPSIHAILLRVDSPGGTVAGNYDLAMDLRNAGKPVWGYIEDLGASAAYRLAVECERIYANEPSALVGSIGTMLGLYDLSGMCEKEGIKPVLLTSGGLKGTGFPGAEVTSEQQAYLQAIVDDHQTEFTAAVARGRNVAIEKVAKEWAIGRVWVASEAASMGLIDGVQSLDATLNALASHVRQPSSGRGASQSGIIQPESSMPNAVQTTAAVLTIAMIQTECGGFDKDNGDDARFAMDHLSRGSSIDEVRKSWGETQAARLHAREQELEELRSKNSAGTTTAVGVDPVSAISGSGAGVSNGGGSATEEFWQAVEAHQAKGWNRQQAISRVVGEDSQLHQRFLAEHNAKHKK